MPSLRWGASTSPGVVRSENEDTFVAEAMVFAVADGMGGHQGGEVASAVAVETLAHEVPITSAGELRAAVSEANRAVHRRATEDETLRGMGTTLCVLALIDGPQGPRLAERSAA